MTKILGRDPVLWLAAVAAAVQFISAFFTPVDIETQGIIAAATLAAVGFIQAVIVRDGSAVPALIGLFKAAVAVGVAFGMSWSPEQQAMVMLFVQAVLSLMVRREVTAPVNAAGQPVVGHGT